MSQVNICRLCLNICRHYQCLYDNDGLGTEVYTLAVKYFDSTILNMELEKHLTVVCLKCWHHLKNFNTFEQDVTMAQSKLNFGEAHKQHEVVIISEDDSGNDNIELNNDEQFIYLHESESIDGNRHKEFSIEFITEDGQISSNDDVYQTPEEFGELPDTSMGGYFIDEDVKGHISLPELELIDVNNGDEFSSDEDEVSQSHCIQNDKKTEVIAGQVDNVINTNMSRTNRKTTKDYDDIIAQWKTSLNCMVCSESLSRYSLLREHFRQKHPNEEFNVACCQRKFSHRNTFEEHVRFHLNQNGFKCQICGKVYTTSRKLTDHLLIQHSGLKIKRSFKCPKCPVRFSSKGKYQLHLAEHANSEHDCSQCGKMFSTGNRRMLHERMAHGIHRLCKECGKTFRDNHDFTQHQLLEHDAGGTLHLCTICGQTAITASDLRVHVATHIKVDMYVCSHCPKTFQYRSSLRNHEKKKHPSEIDSHHS